MNILKIFKKTEKDLPKTNNNEVEKGVGGIRFSFSESLLTQAQYSDYTTSWVNNCLIVRAESVSDCNTYLFKRNTGKIQEIYEHPFIDLMNNVNIYEYGWNQILYLISMNLDVFGNAYLIILKDGKNNPNELIPVPSSMVRPVYNNNYSIIIGYEIGNNKYSKDEILHFKLPSITDLLLGTPTINGLDRIIKVDNLQQIYSEQFFRNFGRISLALQTEQKLGNEVIERLKKDFVTTYSGAENAGKTIVLDNGLKIDDYTQTAKEMDYVESRKIVRDEILSRMRVPPVLIGVNESSNRATADAEMVFFLKHTIKPFSRNIENTLNMFIRKLYGKEYFIKLEHPNPLSDEERKDMELGLRYGAITLNEYREQINYEMLPDYDIMTPVITNNTKNEETKNNNSEV